MYLIYRDLQVEYTVAEMSFIMRHLVCSAVNFAHYCAAHNLCISLFYCSTRM